MTTRLKVKWKMLMNLCICLAESSKRERSICFYCVYGERYMYIQLITKEKGLAIMTMRLKMLSLSAFIFHHMQMPQPTQNQKSCFLWECWCYVAVHLLYSTEIFTLHHLCISKFTRLFEINDDVLLSLVPLSNT